MEIWKAVPSWFKLDNYTDSGNFTSRQWLDEVALRLHFFNALNKPELFLNQAPPSDQAREFFDHIKAHALVSKGAPVDASRLNEFIEEPDHVAFRRKRAAVEDLSQLSAYDLLFDSESREEIINDLLLRDRLSESSAAICDHMEERKAIYDKYSHP